MYVNVPWTDNNTTYSKATSSALGLVKIGYTKSGKNYPVELNSSGQMYVNVPWTDNNTTYTAGNGLTLSSTTLAVGAGTGISVAADTVSFNPTSVESSYVASLSYRPSVLSTTDTTPGNGTIVWYCS
jgi:hypothetical protein